MNIAGYTWETCDSCSGTGIGYGDCACYVCHGTGERRVPHYVGFDEDGQEVEADGRMSGKDGE